MKQKITILTLAVLAATMLSACGIDTGSRFPERTIIVPAPVLGASHEGTIEPGDIHRFTIERIPGIEQFPLFVIELDQDLTLEITNRSASNVYLYSEGPDAFFEPAAPEPEPEVASSSERLSSTQYNFVPTECRGSCIVRFARGENVFFQVSGAEATVDYQIYLFASDYVDAGENRNNRQETAAPLILRTDAAGAIETVGDVDFWRVEVATQHESEQGSFIFHAPNDLIDLRLYVFENGEPIDGYFTDGDVVNVSRGQLLAVRSGNGGAARGQASYYSFEPNLLLGPVTSQAD